MQAMLSIDFGNSYTKVALRISRNNRGELLTDDSIKTDELHACLPTVAALAKDPSGRERWHYGSDVERFRANDKNLKVFRNWKPMFFERAHAELSPWQIAVPAAHTAKPKRVRAKAKVQATLVPEGDGSMDYHAIAVGYFTWLRAFWDGTCLNATNLPASKIPVRISLPSFGAVANSERSLKEILIAAGWMLNDSAPTLPEPLANAIGTFSDGVNCVGANSRSPDYGVMFQQAGLLARMREAILRNGEKTAWAMIVDVGGFSTDFAMLGFDLTELDGRMDGEIDGKKRLTHSSKALGVADLDRDVLGALEGEKRAAFQQIISDPDSSRLEALHVGLYGVQQQYGLRGGKYLGRPAGEGDRIRAAVTDFATRVADYTEDFLNNHRHDRIDDLILTGGGTQISAVRDALMGRLAFYKSPKIHCYIPPDEILASGSNLHRLPKVMPRGATAIGGASVYFDFPSTS